MGILNITAIETGCFGACTNEEVPDKYYDLLVKQEELKDGLEVYKPKSTVYYASQIKCPLCKCRFPEEEKRYNSKNVQCRRRKNFIKYY